MGGTSQAGPTRAARAQSRFSRLRGNRRGPRRSIPSSPAWTRPTSSRVRNGGPFDVHSFRRREWNPAVESSGIAKPARLYDLRSTFASHALAAGVTVYELARIMGTSVAMIEAHHGALLDTAPESLLERLDAVSGMSRA